VALLDRHRSSAIGAFSAVLVALAVFLLTGPSHQIDAPRAGLAWWLLIPVFTAAELVVVHVQARRESLSVSFAEVPLVLGLVYLNPLGLVGARVLGSALGLLRRRQSGLKLFFNLSMFAFEAALAATLYGLALGGADPSSPRGLLAALATVVVTDLASAAALTTVIWLKVGEYDEGVLGEAVTSGLVAALTNTSVGLLVVVLVDTRPVALTLLLAVVVTVAFAYRGYAALSRGHARLESLYRFTRRVQREVSVDAVAEIVLRQARDALSSETAELFMLTGEHAARRLCLIDEDVQSRPGGPARWMAPALAGQAVRRHESTDASGPRDALAAPLEVDGTVLAILVVEDRPHHLGPFGEDDLRLFESLANHAAVSLQNSRLVDRLRKEAETQEHVSLHDALTGLPNRRHALRALTAELTASANTAVLVLDLDGFTEVNEALGYATGDLMLRETGRRLTALATVPGHVARLGNDEFVVVLRDVVDADDAARRAQDVLAAVGAPFTRSELNIDMHACAGLAVAPTHGVDAAMLMQRADAALYAAKRERVLLRVWDPRTEGDSGRRLTLLGHLRESIESGQLEVHYQPKIKPGTGEAVGAEALVRWAHPDHGRVGPDEFIPLAEHSGLIHPLTDQVLDAALAQAALWRAILPTFTIAVNLSARSLTNPDLPRQILTALSRARLPRHALTLEITETAIMTDLDRALTVLHELNALGVGLSIDDFGTGLSSLAYLKTLPVNEVKVDKSFVLGAATQSADEAIVRATIELGHTLGLRVVAEGVEEAEMLGLLAAWGCDVAQGYFISRPIPPEAFTAWLTERVRTFPSVPPVRDPIQSIPHAGVPQPQPEPTARTVARTPLPAD